MEVVRIGETSITSHCEERRDGELLVSGELVHVCVETGGHAAYGPREKQAFANALDRILTRALRGR